MNRCFSRCVASVLIATAMSCPNLIADENGDSDSTGNRYVELLRKAKQASLQSAESLSKSGRPLGAVYDPDRLVIRRYDDAIRKALKTIDEGGEYGQKEHAAAIKTINEQSMKLRKEFIDNLQQNSKATMQQNEAKFQRTIAESRKRQENSLSKANEKFRRSMAIANLKNSFRTNAGKIGLVIWNLPSSSALHQRSTLIVRIDLYQGDRIVWTNKKVRLDHRNASNPIRLPDVMFDKVKVEAMRWSGDGSGIAEVQVFLGKQNVALGRPCEVSSIETVPMHLDDRNAVTDGINTPNEVGVGYWIPEEKTRASVTIDLLGKPDEEVLRAARERLK